jgi:hypothetical protein
MNRSEDNIKMDLQEVGMESIGWVYLGQSTGKLWAVVNTVMNLRAAKKLM